MPSRHALVFGASGITGWGILKAVTVRSLERICISHVRRLKLISKVDLASEEGSVEGLLSSIEGIEEITHVYYAAIRPDFNFGKKVAINVKMLQNAVAAVDKLCSRLEFVLIQTGSIFLGNSGLKLT